MPNYPWINTYDENNYDKLLNNNLTNEKLPKLNQPLTLFIYYYEDFPTTPFATAYEHVTSSTKLRTGHLSFPPSFHNITAHHALQDLDNTNPDPEFPGL